MTMPELDDHALGKPVLEWITARFGPGTRVLELGSGTGTFRLHDAGYDVISIEHDERYLDWAPVSYVHAPIAEDGWYDALEVERAALEGDYDLVIVDGPPGRIGRKGLLRHFDALWPAFELATVVVDDVHRGAERDLFFELSRLLGRKGLFEPSDRGRLFAVLPTWGSMSP